MEPLIKRIEIDGVICRRVMLDATKSTLVLQGGRWIKSSRIFFVAYLSEIDFGMPESDLPVYCVQESPPERVK